MDQTEVCFLPATELAARVLARDVSAGEVVETFLARIDLVNPQINAYCTLDTEWFMDGFSVLHCLPVGLADRPSAGTGTVMRPEMFRRYAREAGYRDVVILPIENYFYTFYRLIP